MGTAHHRRLLQHCLEGARLGPPPRLLQAAAAAVLAPAAAGGGAAPE